MLREALQDKVDKQRDNVTNAQAVANRIANDENEGQLARDEAERVLDDELNKMAEIVRRSLTGLKYGDPVFQGTTEAMVNVPGVDLVGGIEILSLEDIFDNPREHLPNQSPEEADDPQGARVSGVSIRWNRAATPSRRQSF